METHGALREVFAIAAHPRIESLSFGLMDFVSAHRGAIPLSAMGAAGQFDHPLVVRAKLEIAAACHAPAKVPSHCVVTEFKDAEALQAAAETACRRLGYTRMWSIHPAQIRPIVDAFAPTTAEVDLADRDHHRRTGRALGAHPPPRHPARPRQLPLFLAGHRTCAPHLVPRRAAVAGRAAPGLVP